MSEMKLLPCPFCGITPQRGKKLEDGWCGISCYNGHVVEIGGDSPEEAIAAWNRRAGGWQPIDTAPKDGTFVLLLSDESEIYFGRFLGVEWDVGFDPTPEFTHWMPLPTPPEVSE